MEEGFGYEFVNEISDGVIPKEFIPSVDEGIKEQLKMVCWVVTLVLILKVTLYDGSFHDVDSNEMSFKVAGSIGVREGVLNADPALLEPMMKVEVVTPEENMGDVMGDLNRRRGVVQGMDDSPSGKSFVLKFH